MFTNRLAKAAAAMFLVAGASAHAIDGQIDVAPDGAVPFVISAPGSYVLVKNVTMTASVDCIQITSPDVNLDLNGHTIAGTGTGATTADGIDMGSNARVSIRNGTIRRFGGNGINATSGAGTIGADLAALSDLVVADCVQRGLLVGGSVAGTAGFGSRISRATVRGNGLDGIFIGGDATVENCIAVGNNRSGGTAGIRAILPGVAVLNCVANNNSTTNTTALGSIGIRVSDRSRVENCTANGNNFAGTGASQAVGIFTGASCRIAGNDASGNVASSGTVVSATGIITGVDCVVAGNVAANNKAFGSGSGVGIQTGNGATLIGNTASRNDGGSSGGGVGILALNESTLIGNIALVNRSGASSATPARGISADDFCIIENNVSQGNSGQGANGSARGILAGAGCSIKNNVCADNRGAGTGTSYGIETDANCSIEGNEIASQIADTGAVRGILTLAHSRVVGNTISGASSEATVVVVAIEGGQACTISNNTISETSNTGAGGAKAIFVTTDATVSGNDIYFTEADAGVYGIHADANCSVLDNRVVLTISNEVGFARGIQAGNQSAIRGNRVLTSKGADTGNGIGIDAGDRCEIVGNEAIGNLGGGSGGASGITAGDACLIRNNICADNREGAGGTNSATGINAGNGCAIEGNSASGNDAGAPHGSAFGISAGVRSTVRNNQVTDHTAAGTGVAYGIRVSGNSLVENNHASLSTGDSDAYGIFVEGAAGGTLVRLNVTSLNGSAGIRLSTDDNRSEQNRMAEGAVSTVAGNAFGAGDLADFGI